MDSRCLGGLGGGDLLPNGRQNFGYVYIYIYIYISIYFFCRRVLHEGQGFWTRSVYGHNGSICHFPRALPARHMGTLLSKSQFLLAIWQMYTKRGVDNDIFRAVCIKAYGYVGTPTALLKQGKIAK